MEPKKNISDSGGIEESHIASKSTLRESTDIVLTVAIGFAYCAVIFKLALIVGDGLIHLSASVISYCSALTVIVLLYYFITSHYRNMQRQDDLESKFEKLKSDMVIDCKIMSDNFAYRHKKK